MFYFYFHLRALRTIQEREKVMEATRRILDMDDEKEVRLIYWAESILKYVFVLCHSLTFNMVPTDLEKCLNLNAVLKSQTCQPLRILRNHYAFRVSNTPLRKPVKNVEKLRILRNFGAIRSIPRNLQQLSRLVVSRKSPAGQNIDKGLVYFTITIGIGVRFRHPINKWSCRGETMPNET